MLKLELKRIFSKKINVFAIGLALILAVIFSGFAVTSNRYVDKNGNASTGIMATRKLTDNRRAWKGTLTEDELGKVIEQNKNAVTQSSEENAIYGTTLQPIDDIRSFIISVLTPDSEYDESVSVKKEITSIVLSKVENEEDFKRRVQAVTGKVTIICPE